MNNKHILDLTLRLSQALDQNYDVVSMETVLSVISVLEGTTITKEQLETTRLAKYINQLRRRTKCEHLARRAKSLLKKWREMVGIQQSHESSPATSSVANVPTATIISSSSAASAPFNIPVTDNAVSTSHLTNPKFSHQHQRHQQYQINAKQYQMEQQSYLSQPSSPVNLQEKSNPNEFLISMSNPATSSQVPKSSNTNARKKRRLEKNSNKAIAQQRQPTSFANLITGLGTTINSSRKGTREISETVASKVKPVETFIIEHSSNSNSDLICIPSNNTVSSNFTSATYVPPVVIDLQDTNSSMNSLVSKDVTNASSSYRNKISTKKSKKEKKRKDRNVMSRQSQPLQDCDDQNTTVTSYLHKRPTDVLLLDEKSHSACPTISNISEILSLSNSSMSSVFPSADAISKNVFQSGQNELVSATVNRPKSDLTFAGKFKQSTSSSSTGCNVLNYNSDSTNRNILNNNSPVPSSFHGIGSTNSNDSSSSSRTSSFHDVVNSVKKEASTSIYNIENRVVKPDMNEKSMSNMSNKGNSSTDNAFTVGASSNAKVHHQQSTNLVTQNLSSQQVVKQAKKRGRKKGSKGVDNVIAKHTSLSSQMLISSLGVAGKKVKTTKELYAEMESRKLRNVKISGVSEMSGNSSSNWIGQQKHQKPFSSRRQSFCSDIIESDSCTMTSEQSLDSGNILNKIPVDKHETQLLDNNSNYSKYDSEFKIGDIKSDEGSSRLLPDENSVLDMTTKLKCEIQEILKLFTPPPSVEEIEYECLNSTTQCTCTIEEVTAPANNESEESIGDNDSKDSSSNVNVNETEKPHLKIQIQQVTNAINSFQRTDVDQIDALHHPPTPVKVKKSIFDLDFDDEEDPLKLIIADIASKKFKAETEVKAINPPPVIENKSEVLLSTEDDHGKVHHQNAAPPYALNVPTASSPNKVFPSYEVQIDPDCKAKIRYEVQTQKITKFHIDTLHNCFIPNVNGNWNHANAVSTCNRIKDDCHATNLIMNDGYNVVPFYGTDMNEQIVKDLSHVKYTTKFQVERSRCQNQNEILFNIPFLGVSRIPEVTDTKCKDSYKLTFGEEKENVDNKPNSNNEILNTSALDTIDTKENTEIGMEYVQSAEMCLNTKKLKTNKNSKTSGFKCTKKHENFVKQSTCKRFTQTANKNLEANTHNSNDTNYVDEVKLHTSLFYHEEIRPVYRSGSRLYKECIFHISSCSSGCSSADEDEANTGLNCRKRKTSSSSSSASLSSPSSEYNVLNLQQQIVQSEFAKMVAHSTKNDAKLDKVNVNENVNDCNNLPEENNHMLFSFNNIYNKSTRDEYDEQENKDHENTLKQQLQNCDDYNNLNNNFTLINYIDNKISSVNNNNNNTNSCSNNYSDTNINISSSSCSHENPTNSALMHHYNNNNNNNSNNSNNDNDVPNKLLNEYQTGIRAVDEDVNDDDGNSCSRLQQFKEWHEVLQLRSYNDDLLTVLPYVVLD